MHVRQDLHAARTELHSKTDPNRYTEEGVRTAEYRPRAQYPGHVESSVPQQRIERSIQLGTDQHRLARFSQIPDPSTYTQIDVAALSPDGSQTVDIDVLTLRTIEVKANVIHRAW